MKNHVCHGGPLAGHVFTLNLAPDQQLISAGDLRPGRYHRTERIDVKGRTVWVYSPTPESSKAAQKPQPSRQHVPA